MIIMSCLRYSANYVWSTSHELGSGATAFVYQGLDKKTGDSVAVKTFKNCRQFIPLEVQMREFDVMKKLSHENIVKMVAMEDETEVQSQKKVLVMELCNGGSLFTILKDPQNRYGLEEEEFLRVLKDLSAGVKYLRDNNFIHRDLKPGNIMKFISEDGRSIYKVTDFGAARVLDDDQQFMSLYGTEEYLHPDMFETAVLHRPPSKTYGATVDLWSIGVTLYQVATGSLPFRPFGGRPNKRTMHYITTNKASDVISGVQHSNNGPIEWSKELPETCLLNQGLRELVTNLLAGILECDDTKVWTFDQYFECVLDIFSRKVFHVFYMNECKEICLYLHPNKMLDDLKDQIQAQTKVPSSSQLLLFEKTLFISQINTSAEVSTFPETSLDQPLILIHMESALKDLTTPSMSEDFYLFSSSPVRVDQDASLANTCCSVAHTVKRLVVILVRYQKLLLRIPKILLSLSVENVLKLCSDSDVLKQKTDDMCSRTDLLAKSCSIFAHFVSMQSSQDRVYNELLCLDEIVSKKRKMRDQVKERVTQVLTSIKVLRQKVCVSEQLQNAWDQTLSKCCNLAGCIEKADTYVGRMRESWQSFYNYKKSAHVLSTQAYQFYMLERVKMGQNSKRLLNLQDQCTEACLQAFNKLDEWYSGMQAIMVQCKCVEEDLNSASNDLLTFCTEMHKGEIKSFEISENLALLNAAEKRVNSSNSDDENSALHNAKSAVQNVEITAESKKNKFEKVFSQIKVLKDEQACLQKSTEENKDMITEFLSMFNDLKKK